MSQFDTCFFERYAKISLETLLDEGFSSLVNKDRPDLQSPDGVSLGIEVTRAMPESKEAARSMLKEIIDIGETVKISYVDQQHRSIDPDKTVFETIAGNSEWVRLGNKDINARAWVSRFNFSGSDQEKLCGVLSGGERNRLHLALTLKDEGNVLLLDEPTKGMDAASKQELSRLLRDIAADGCAVLLVTHDTELAADCADMCGMLFNGEILNEASPEEMFRENYFYTTPMARLIRGTSENK